MTTGHKTFDQQNNEGWMLGNVVSTGQLSYYIRPVDEATNGGNTFSEGKLRRFDLGHFSALPVAITEWFDQHLTDTYILYEFRHWTRAGKRLVHGYVITGGHADGHKLAFSLVVGKRASSGKIITTAIAKVTKS